MRWLAGLLLAAVAVDAAKVLFLPSTLHPSHPATMKHLADELAKRKHTVVWAEHGPIESKTVLRSGVERIFWKTNFEDAHLESVFLYKNHSSVTAVWTAGEDNANEQTTGWLAGARLCDRLLANRKKQFDELVKREFDTVVVDDLYNPCGLLMAGLKKSVFVYWSLTSLRTESAWSHHSPSPPSYIPVPGTGLTDELTFWQRTFNLASYLKAIFVHQNIVQTRIDAVYQHYYPGVESHFALERNASINLVNTPPIFDFARPFMPRVNFVGGLHCRNATKLPAKFGEFVDASNDDFGFVVFSVGYAQWKNAGERIKDAFLAAFRSNPHTRFVWQYSGRPLMNMPDNVLTADWLPLQDLLGHPKCRAHITTGGINSVIESVWHGVPVIGYPLTARGRDNLLRVTARGAGVMLEKEKLSVVKITSALDRIRDMKYKEEMLVFQDMVRDVPYTELDHAAFWVEFIERHQEVPHARSGADKLHVLQYFLVDVISFLLSCAAAALAVAYFVVRTAFRIVVAVFRSLFGRTSVKVVEKKEQKKEQKKEKKEEQKEKEQPKKSKKAKKTD